MLLARKNIHGTSVVQHKNRTKKPGKLHWNKSQVRVPHSPNHGFLLSLPRRMDTSWKSDSTIFMQLEIAAKSKGPNTFAALPTQFFRVLQLVSLKHPKNSNSCGHLCLNLCPIPDAACGENITNIRRPWICACHTCAWKAAQCLGGRRDDDDKERF